MVDPESLRASLPEIACAEYSDENLERLGIYAETLLKWNKTMNLTGLRDFNRLIREQIIDSLRVAEFLEKIAPGFSGETWDVGAGAGLPGVPLRIFWQKGAYKMIESREKRALFVEHILDRLKLPETSIIRARFEDFLKTNPQKPRCILSKAFLPWPRLLKLFEPWIDGFLIVLANTPPPALPWTLVDETSYSAASKTRWLWALSPRR